VGVLDRKEQLRSEQHGRKIDRDETAHEALGDLALERDAVAPGANRAPQPVPHVDAALEVRGQLDGLARSGQLRTRKLDPHVPLAPHVRSVPRKGDATTHPRDRIPCVAPATRERPASRGGAGRLVARLRGDRALRTPDVRDPTLARPADSVQQLSAGRRGGQVDRDQPVGETLGDPELELEVAEPVRAHRSAEEIAQLLASLEVRGHLDRLAKREELSARPFDADRCRRPHIHGIAGPAARRAGAWYGVQLATRSGAPNGRSTSGTSPWKFSRIARAIRSTTAVPFNVWTGSGPCSPRKRICRRRAWKSVVFEIDAVS